MGPVIVARALSDGGFYLGELTPDTTGFTAVAFGGLQRGLHVMEFQSLAVAVRGGLDPTVVGGTQDNGVLHFTGPAAWHAVARGDGGAVVIDANAPVTKSPARIFYTNYGSSLVTGDVGKIAPWPLAVKAPGGDAAAAVYPPVIQDPNADSSGEKAVFLGAAEVYRYSPKAGSFGGGSVGTIGASVAPSDPDKPCDSTYPDTCRPNVITAMAIAPTDSNRIYVGYYDGRIYGTWNARASTPNWFLLRGSPTTFTGVVTGIAVHPLNADKLYAVFAGASNAAVLAYDDATTTWTDLTGSLDSTAINTVAVEVQVPYRLMIGRDDGAYYRPSSLAAAAWKPLGVGLPKAPVYAIGQDGFNGIYVATHGRGVFHLGDALIRIWRDDCPGCYDFSPILPLPGPGPGSAGYTDLPVFAYGLPRNASCSMRLLQGTTVCAAGTRDPFGRSIRTNALGQLVSQGPVGAAAQHVYACANGRCVGDVLASRCSSAHVTSLELRCGGQVLTKTIAAPENHAHPATTGLQIGLLDGPVIQGVVELEVALRDATGVERPLCSATAGMGPADQGRDVLERLRDTLNASPTCVQQGVTAWIPENGKGEDAATGAILQVDTTQEGLQVVTRLRAQAPGAFLTVRGFGNGEVGSSVAPTLQIVVPSDANGGTVGAAGGSLTVALGGYDGSCRRTLKILPGETASRLVRRVALALALPSNECPGLSFPQVGMFDLANNASSLSLRGALLVSVTTTDPSIVLTIGSRSVAGQVVPPQAAPASLAALSSPISTTRTPGTLTSLGLRAGDSVSLFGHAAWPAVRRVSPKEAGWSTSNDKVVSVEGGLVTGVAPGSATLQLTWGPKTVAIPVLVLP